MHPACEEAEASCKWCGTRLPAEAEWKEADYTERRGNPHCDSVEDQDHTYPTGISPAGAAWLKYCDSNIASRFSHRLDRGIGPSLVELTKRVF